MSWVAVTFRCGCAGHVQAFGNRSDRERKANWLAERRACEPCFAAEREAQQKAEQEAAKAQAEEWELPALEGTEKQVAWAERIRADLVKAIEAVRALGNLETCDPDGFFEEGVVDVLARSDVQFWIDTVRGWDLHVTRLRDDIRYIGKQARKEIGKAGPTIVQPEGQIAVSQVTIRHEPGEILLTTTRKESDALVERIKDIGFRWSSDHWYFHCTPSPVPLDNVAAGVASEVLAMGYSVVLPQPTVVDVLSSGEFERDPVRKLVTHKDGKAFLLRWRKSDGIYDVVKSLPGARWDSPYMKVPATASNEVMDLAERLGFWISDTARDLARSVDTIEVKGERVQLGRPAAVAVTEKQEGIHADLRDE